MSTVELEKEIEVLRQEIRDLLARPTLDDVVASVFAQFIEARGVSGIPSNKAIIHSLFANLADDADAPAGIRDILSQLNFEVGDYCPFSRELEAAIMRLQLGGLMSAMNPDFRSYTMSTPQREEAARRTKRMDDASQAFLKSAAEMFSVEAR